jgi:hypothetical protein
VVGRAPRGLGDEAAEGDEGGDRDASTPAGDALIGGERGVERVDHGAGVGVAVVPGLGQQP